MSAPAKVLVTGLGVIAPGPAPEPGWFQLASALPGRGYKKLPSGCQYLLAAARSALLDTGDWVREVPPERRGAVIGTNNAGAALLDSMDRTIIDLDAAELSPAGAPFMAMSLFASRLSPEHQLNAFNLTTNSPTVAGLEALQIAARALAADRASVLLVGATEEAPPAGQFDSAGADVGAVVLVCESEATAIARSAPVYGTCVVRSAFLSPTDVTAIDALDALDALERLWTAMADGPPDRIDTVLDDSPVGTTVAAWLEKRACGIEIATVDAVTGGGCLTPIRRIVDLLTTTTPRPVRHAVVTASAQGNISVAEVTVLSRTPLPHEGS